MINALIMTMQPLINQQMRAKYTNRYTCTGAIASGSGQDGPRIRGGEGVAGSDPFEFSFPIQPRRIFANGFRTGQKKESATGHV
jgi:hypothetical protein